MLAGAAEDTRPTVPHYYRFGDALLRLDVGDPALLRELAWSYADCAVSTEEIDEAPVFAPACVAVFPPRCGG